MKTVFSIFLFAISLMGISQNLQDSLLLYYPMNGNCLDSSGNGFDAYIINADLTTDHNGHANKAYHFNGVDQYIDWPANNALHPELPISVAFWVKFDVANYVNGAVFDSDFEQNLNSGSWVSITSGGNFNISFGDASGSIGPTSRRSKTGTTQVQSGVWYYVVGVIRGATDMDLYVNCVNDGGTYSGTGGGIVYTTMRGSLGRLDADIYNPAYQLDGSLDDFRYWNRALSASDVEKLCTLDDVVENELAKFELFPNPTMEYLTISDAPEEAYLIDITSINGIVLQSAFLGETINVGGLNSGVYIVRIVDCNGAILGAKTFVKM